MTRIPVPQIIAQVVGRFPEVAPLLSRRAHEALKAAQAQSTYRQKRRKARQREQETQDAVARAFEQAKQQVLRTKAYNQDELRAALTIVLQQQMADIAREQVTDNAASISFGFDPAAVDHTVQAWAQSYSYDLIEGLNKNTLATVQDAVTAFTDTPGMTIGDLSDLLEPAFGQARAESIAVTEVTRAYAQGESVFQDFMNEEGVDTVRVWLTSEDETVCPICGELNGKEAAPGEGFGSDIDNPPAHPNCRCAVQTRLA